MCKIDLDYIRGIRMNILGLTHISYYFKEFGSTNNMSYTEINKLYKKLDNIYDIMYNIINSKINSFIIIDNNKMKKLNEYNDINDKLAHYHYITAHEIDYCYDTEYINIQYINDTLNDMEYCIKKFEEYINELYRYVSE